MTAAAGALALLTACGGGSAGSTAGREGTSGGPAPATPVATPVDTTSSARPSAAVNDADVMFAQMMIPHHEQAVEMAGLAATRAGDPEIKQLAARIKAAQDPEIRTMKGWLAAWGKPAADPGHGMDHEMPGVMSEEDMTKLRAATGRDFDKLFARQMIAHHEGAIEMARTEQARGADPEARELARAIETTQRAEVAQLRKILDRL
ncbi:DUF305 domain-containing protein [Nonomuraea candida]|uniref:DUF305 domain-containing protein n=1 Tax=Nonomuraea candida TaxID=359159 RepID=UPI000B0A61EF|nr:DUF305 domain-containing protein [Nonomuraea candida]